MNWQQIEDITGKELIHGPVIDFLKESLIRGHKITLHGHTHTKVCDMDKHEIKARLMEGKKILEDIFGIVIEYFVPPFNANSTRLMEACEELRLKILCRQGGRLEKSVRENLKIDKFDFVWYHYWRFYNSDITPEMLDKYLCQHLQQS
jgi:predicted deacetylase